MTQAKDYLLSPSAGPSTTLQTQSRIVPNTSEAYSYTHPSGHQIDLHVFINAYRGLPRSAPQTHPYFTHALHTSSLYGLLITFTPSADIPGDELVLGNDFDHPIRQKLPMWFGAAWKALKYLDPTVEGDVYGDKPGIWGPALSSVNYITVGHGGEEGLVPGEDMSAAASEFGLEIPSSGTARQKFFQSKANRDKFVFKKGVSYTLDFGNGFLDFNEFGLRLPGFKVSALKYWDGQPLRYVLKNRRTNEVYCAVVFSLVEDTKDAEEKVAATIGSVNENLNGSQNGNGVVLNT